MEFKNNIKELPKCPLCKERDGRVLLEDVFVCFQCYNSEHPKVKKMYENRIIEEAAKILSERNANAKNMSALQ